MSSGLEAELRVGLGGHAIGAAEEGEVVHIGGTEIGLERAEDVARAARSCSSLSRDPLRARAAARWRERS